MRKNEQRKARQHEPPGLPSKKAPLLTAPEKDNETFDFGGMPLRDLKKNLGCG